MRSRSTPARIRLHASTWPSGTRRTLAAGGILVATGGLALAAGSTATGPASQCTEQFVERGSLPRFFPKRTSGDREFEGHGPAITVSAKRVLISQGDPDRLVVDVKMTAEETRSDWSTAAEQERYPLFTAPPGCQISSVFWDSFDSNGYLARPLLSNPHRLEAGNRGVDGSFVGQGAGAGDEENGQAYKVWDDRVGNDIGSYTSVRVRYRAFTVRFVD